jgi:hypothetical protein
MVKVPWLLITAPPFRVSVPPPFIVSDPPGAMLIVPEVKLKVLTVKLPHTFNVPPLTAMAVKVPDEEYQ